MLRIILGVGAAAFTVYTVSYTVQSNLTLGLAMLYLISIVLIGSFCFYHRLAGFLSTQIGKVTGILCLVAAAVYIGTALFIGLCAGVSRPRGDEQVLIVLGAGLKGENISTTLKYRLDAAYEYCVQNPDLTVVVSGGQGNGESVPEAVAMKRYLVGRGIQSDRILEETVSSSTKENFLFSEQLLQSAGVENSADIVFVTNRFHCYRAALIARREGIQTTCIPASISPSAWLPCYLREVLAVWYYWFFR